jgi:hypothetical protein
MVSQVVIRMLIAAGLVLLPNLALAQNYAVTVKDPSQPFSFAAGESQSTVVPPGLKSQCTGGRMIVTNDNRRPTDPQSVVWRDLNNNSSGFTATTFDAIPNSANYLFGTNDHDIITMPNGDVILEWGVHMDGAVNPKPAWFDDTYHSTFGPGVRRGLMTWLSDDCGQSFKYRGQIDPATTADGTCAFPQFRRDANHNIITEKPYYNGGSDGQLMKLDRANNKIYVMFPCMGFKQDKTQPGFVLSTNPLSTGMVLVSTDEGANWKFLGWQNVAVWRYGVLPISQGNLAFGQGNVISFGTKLSDGTYKFDTSGIPTPNGGPNWDGNFDGAAVKAVVYANVYANTIVSRVPGKVNDAVLTFPATVPAGSASAYGYRMFFYDKSANTFGEAKAIVPLVKNNESFVMHLAAIDPGSGPVLLYWYDLDVQSGKGLVRGRLVSGAGTYSSDFTITENGPTASYFGLGNSSYWYGDYKTAGGYVQSVPLNPGPGKKFSKSIYHYFPMWVEPDQTVRYVEVTAEAMQKINVPHFYYAAINKWVHPALPVEFSKIKVIRVDDEIINKGRTQIPRQ